MSVEDDKQWYFFVNLRNGQSRSQGEYWTSDHAAKENERVAKTLGKHFRYVTDVEQSVAEWVEERD